MYLNTCIWWLYNDIIYVSICDYIMIYIYMYIELNNYIYKYIYILVSDVWNLSCTWETNTSILVGIKADKGAPWVLGIPPFQRAPTSHLAGPDLEIAHIWVNLWWIVGVPSLLDDMKISPMLGSEFRMLSFSPVLAKSSNRSKHLLQLLWWWLTQDCWFGEPYFPVMVTQNGLSLKNYQQK